MPRSPPVDQSAWTSHGGGVEVENITVIEDDAIRGRERTAGEITRHCDGPLHHKGEACAGGCGPVEGLRCGN